MGPGTKHGSAVLVRLLIFGVLIVAVRFIYVAVVLGENSQPEALIPFETERNSLFYYSAVFQDMIKSGFLSKTSKSLCLSEEPGQEQLALREIGVGQALRASPKKFVLPFSNGTFDFIFSGHGIERSAKEISRTLKKEGFLLLHTSSGGDQYSFNSLSNLFPGFTLQMNRETRGPDNAFIRQIILKKSEEHEEISSSECKKSKFLQSAEPLIEEEPIKPWITLKNNARNIKYLPSMVDISFKTRYIYIDVGARSYGSSIVSWFKKQYPKQNKTFEIYAIEADRSFYKDYESRKGVNLIKFAAWVRNETLSFEVEGGMGRIIPAVGLGGSGSVGEIQGLDFAEWLKGIVGMTDYVVVKMDIEGAEFQVIPRLIETGAICLIDELFLECHYNRWQRCCPGKRSPKYKNTFGQCLNLFNELRSRGVLVHQWW